MTRLHGSVNPFNSSFVTRHLSLRLKLRSDNLENRSGVRKLPGLLLGIDLLSIDADFKDATTGRN